MTILRCRWIGTLFLGFIALSVAILAALLLPGQAEAQEQATPKTTTKLVEPGDSLWTIAQARLSPDAAPQQVAEEVGRIYELNRDQIGENPNLIFPGQQFFWVPPPPAGDLAWVDDEPPEGARLGGNEEWRWVDSDPTPFSGTTAHQSNVLDGYHQHEFTGASAPLSVNRGERLFAFVYLDPDTVPEEVMLQWNDGSSWEHRAYWGADKIVNVGEEAESAPAESAPATTTRAGGEGIVAAVLEALNDLKGERRLLGVGILALTLIVALLMAWRLPMRRNVGDPQAWGIPQQQYDENYAPAEAPLEAPPETARGPEGEPGGAASGAASSSASGPPPEEATREPSVSSDTGSSSPAASGAEEDVVAEGSAVAASAPGQERLKRVRHLRRISQRRSPSGWRGG